MKATVCMGWRNAGRDRAWISGVTFLFNQLGAVGASILEAPRKREGKREFIIVAGGIWILADYKKAICMQVY